MKAWTSVLILCAAGLAIAQDIPVEAIGYGVSIEAATRSAQRAAVEKGIGQVITSQTELENFQVKRDLVLTRTEGAVKSFEVLKKTQGPDGAWEVTLRAVVSKAQIREDLRALAIVRLAVGNPRVAILVKETILGKPMVDGAVEHQVVQAFRTREFQVVDASEHLRSQRAREIALALTGDAKAAVGIGSALGAEVVIIGTAEATEADMSSSPYFKNTGMRSASGVITLKAVNVGTKEIIASTSGDAPMVNPNAATAGAQALEKAAKKALEGESGLIDQLVKSWRDKAQNGNLYNVRVQNVPNFQASQIVIEELRTEAVSVKPTKFADKVQVLEVSWRGTAEDLCAAVEGRKINQGRNTLSVVSVEGDAIVLEVK